MTARPRDAPQLTLADRGAAARGRTDSRIRLPKKRRGFTQEARVGGHKIFLRTGEYEDGTLGEIFIDMHKEGAAFRSLMNCFAMARLGRASSTACRSRRTSTSSRSRASSRRALVEGHPNVKFATSIVDYLFRVLGVEYLHRYDLAHVQPDDASPTQDPGRLRSAPGGHRGDARCPSPHRRRPRARRPKRTTPAAATPAARSTRSSTT